MQPSARQNKYVGLVIEKKIPTCAKCPCRVQYSERIFIHSFYFLCFFPPQGEISGSKMFEGFYLWIAWGTLSACALFSQKYRSGLRGHLIFFASIGANTWTTLGLFCNKRLLYYACAKINLHWTCFSKKKCETMFHSGEFWIYFHMHSESIPEQATNSSANLELPKEKKLSLQSVKNIYGTSTVVFFIFSLFHWRNREWIIE